MGGGSGDGREIETASPASDHQPRGHAPTVDPSESTWVGFAPTATSDALAQCLAMGEFGRSGGGPAGGQFPRPVGDGVAKEHFKDIEEAVEHEHLADEAIAARERDKPRRRWFRRRG
jgi:hypothetical protein